MSSEFSSLTAVIEEAHRRIEMATARSTRAENAIRRHEYGPDHGQTKQDLIATREYARGERWGLTVMLDNIKSLNPRIVEAGKDAMRVTPGTCMSCGEPHMELPDYCGSDNECLKENEYIVTDPHGNDWKTCTDHLGRTLTAVGPSKVEPLDKTMYLPPEEDDEDGS